MRQIEELEERVKGGETLNEVSRTRLSSPPPPLPPSPCSLPLSLSGPAFTPRPTPPSLVRPLAPTALLSLQDQQGKVDSKKETVSELGQLEGMLSLKL